MGGKDRYHGGVGGGKFSPDRSVTRQEAATLLTRQRKLSGEDIAADSSIVKQFTDGGTIADWAAAGVAYCAKTGLVQGKPGKVFAPKSTITARRWRPSCSALQHDSLKDKP